MLSRMSLSAVRNAGTKSQFFIKNQSINRSLHVICQARIISTPNILKCKANVEKISIRYASSEFDTFEIPSPPTVPTLIDETPVIAENISELARAGLGTSWTPVSLVQNVLEFMHTSVGLPWWGSIVTMTIIVRLACFPLVLKAQKNNIEMLEYMPEYQELNNKLMRARAAKDMIAVERYSQDLRVLMHGRELAPFKSLLPSIAQGAIALSCYFALRGMTEAPLESMKEGGLWWFTNLCIPDPHLILPFTSCSTLLFLLYSSSKMIPIPENTKKILLGLMPVFVFFCIKSFPAGTLVYWVTTNSVTVVQQQFLKMQVVKNYFKILDPPKTNRNNVNPQGFIKTFKQNMENVQIVQQIHERDIIKELQKRQVDKIVKQTKRSKTPKIARKDSSL